MNDLIFSIPPPRKAKARRRHGQPSFTLVEMLLVMVIISLVLAFSGPAWRALSGLSGRGGGVNGVMAAFDQARALAIGEGRATYVVFARYLPQFSPSQQPLAQDRWSRAYAIYQDRDNVSFQPVQHSPWLLLPVGVAFKSNPGSDGSTVSVLNRPLEPGVDPQFPVSPAGGAPGGNVQLPYLKFDSTGAVDEQDASYLRVLLWEGFVSGSGVEVATKRITNGGGTSDQQKYLYNEIRVNPATGRAKYLVNAADNLATPQPTATP